MRGQNENLLKQIAKINVYIHTYIYIHTKKNWKKFGRGGHCPPSPTIVPSLSVIDDEPVKLETTSW